MLKSFWQNNEHFADLFNAALFEGRQVIDPALLMDGDTDLAITLVDNDHMETLHRMFDVVKKTVHGVDYMLFVLENQQNVHYAMPLRHMLNEALAYYKEYTEITLRNKVKGKYATRAEFLSGFKKTDRLHPIISLCVYYGESEWDGPLEIKDMLNVPDDVKSLVTDYKMHLVQIHKNGDLKFHNEDVRTVFEICNLLYDHRVKDLKALYKDQVLRPDLGIVVGSIVGSKRLRNYAVKAQQNKEEVYMWKALQEWETECERRGEVRGEARGLFKGIVSTYKEFHISQMEAIQMLKNNHGISQEEATGYVQRYW